jgi:hypothetical protein
LRHRRAARGAIHRLRIDAPPISRGCAECHQQNAKNDQQCDDNEYDIHHAYQDVQQHKERDTAQNGLYVFHASFWTNYAAQLMVSAWEVGKSVKFTRTKTNFGDLGVNQELGRPSK